MTDAETKLRDALHRRHYYCEDTFYSCPFAPEGCSNDFEDKTKCQCGADEHNAQIDALVAGFAASVRAETLREVRGVVEKMPKGSTLSVRNEVLMEVFSRLDALAHPEGTK